MGRNQKIKQERRRQKRERPRLLESLNEQKGFLERSARAFDAGEHSEALRLATAIRTLVHDTNNSHSLLQQLAVKEKITYTATNRAFDPSNLLPTYSLVSVKIDTSRGLEGFSYSANLGGGPPVGRKLQFTQWWHSDTVVFLPKTKLRLCRKDLVCVLANKQGGAHVDPNLDDSYEELVTNNGVGLVLGLSGNSETIPMPGDLVAVSVRQIAYELIETINRHETLLKPG